jgi:hypothetical protein
MLHDTERVDVRDKYFVCGGNPDGSGGGVIGTRNTWDGALYLKIQAIKADYNNVRILTYQEMMADDDIV